MSLADIFKPTPTKREDLELPQIFNVKYRKPEPHRCPVCEGDGVVAKGGTVSGAPVTVECHGCGGKGWVTV